MMELIQFGGAVVFIALMGFLGLLQWRILRRERRNEQYLWAILRTARTHNISSPKKLLRED